MRFAASILTNRHRRPRRKRNPCPYRRAIARFAFDDHAATEKENSLAQTDETKGVRFARVLRVEAATVVPDCQQQIRAALFNCDFNEGRVGVFGYVGQRFLQNAINRRGMGIL